MRQLQTVEHLLIAQLFDAAKHLSNRETELALHAARFLPATRAARRKLHAETDLRSHAQLLRTVDDAAEFVIVFDDDDDRLAELGAHQCEVDVFDVFIAIADDERLVGFEHGQHGEQLGLAAGFEAELVWIAELHDLFDNVALLVHLDREHAHVLAGVVVRIEGGLKRGVEFVEARLDDVAKPHQQRQAQAALAQLVDQFLQVEARTGGALGADLYGAAVVNAEVTGTPSANAVEIAGVFDGPGAAGFGNGTVGRGGGFGHCRFLVISRSNYLNVSKGRPE